MTHDLDPLIRAAQAAERYFHNLIAGNGLNGPSDAITIGRDLMAALADLECICEADYGPPDCPRHGEKRRLTRTEKLQGLADSGCDTWEEYRQER